MSFIKWQVIGGMNNMGRLIDADALIQKIWEKHKETEEYYDIFVDDMKDVFRGVVATVEEQPTAYDVEKVVAELEKDSYEEYCSCCEIVRLKNAIDIIRKGGIE